MALPYPTLLSSIIVKICLIGPIVGTKHTKKKDFLVSFEYTIKYFEVYA